MISRGPDPRKASRAPTGNARRKAADESMKAQRHSLVGPPDLWEMKRNFQISFLRSRGLRPEHYLLDIGCGTLRGGIPIISYMEERHYYGIDVRDYVLEEGRKELREEGLEHKAPILLSFETFEDLELDIRFDFMWAFSVLIHMRDDIVESLFQFVSTNINTHGIFYANISTYEIDDGIWQEFPLVHRGVDFYRNLAGLHALSVHDLGTLQSLGHVTGRFGQDEKMSMLAFRRLR